MSEKETLRMIKLIMFIIHLQNNWKLSDEVLKFDILIIRLAEPATVCTTKCVNSCLSSMSQTMILPWYCRNMIGCYW